MKNSAFAAMILFVASGTAQAGPVDITANQKERLTSVGNLSTRTFYQYDNNGRTIATQYVQDGQSRTLTTSYGYPQTSQSTDGPGIVVLNQTFPDGEQVVYTYDVVDMQVGIRSVLGTVTEDIVRDVRRNERGQPTRIDLGNGVVTTFEYDDSGHMRLVRTASVNAAGQKIQDYAYAYDKNGNVIATTDGVHSNQSVVLDYDSLDQLIAFRNPPDPITGQPGSIIENYEYDSIGNLTQKGALTQSYNAGGRPHALAMSGGIPYVYDNNGAGNGNVTAIGSTTTIEWNAENMPTKVTSGASVTAKSFLGETLWKKSENGVTTYYLPGMRVENGIARKYYGTFAERLEQPGDRQLRFYHPDHLGSSSAMTDKDGKAIRQVSYFPWGQDRGVDGTFVPKLQFNFKEKDASGFYDYGSRLYNPVTGRWLSADSVLNDGLNRYAYARNNPWTRVDPSGHDSKDGYFVSCFLCKITVYSWYEPSMGELPFGWARVDMRNGFHLFKELRDDNALVRLNADGSAQEYDDATDQWKKYTPYHLTLRQMERAVDYSKGPQPADPPSFGQQVFLEVGRQTRSSPFSALELTAQIELALFTAPTGGAGPMTTIPWAKGVQAEVAVTETAATQALVQTNYAAGKAWEQELAVGLAEEGRTVIPQVAKKTPFGWRYIDLEVWYEGKCLGGIEAKVGGSRYLPAQRAKDLWLRYFEDYVVTVARKP